MTEERIITPGATREDEAVEASIRPQRLDDYLGQQPVRDQMSIYIEAAKKRGEPLKMGVVFPVSTHNYELRYWLAASGIHPGLYTAQDSTGTTGADVLLSVTPPPQMPATLEAGTIHGYCVGEPWNQQALVRGIGVPVTTDYDIWKDNPEKVFGVTAEWARTNERTHRATLKALIRAGKWLDASIENRKEAARILARKDYVGADYEVLAATVDDAAGEAFDKAARVLGLGYPGGPAISKAAEAGDSVAYTLPRPRVGETLDFSFSGLKTALIRQLQQIQGLPLSEQPGEPTGQMQADLAASFQCAVVETLVRNTMQAVAAAGVSDLAIAGGVAANRLLRERLAEECAAAGIAFHRPPPDLCTDNAVMIAIAAARRLDCGEPDNLNLDVYSAMPRECG
mgnify:CR=1 FL=1